MVRRMTGKERLENMAHETYVLTKENLNDVTRIMYSV